MTYDLEELLNMTYDDIKHFNKQQLLDLTKQITKYARTRKITTKRELKNLGIPDPTIYRNFKEKKTPYTQSRLNFNIYKRKLETNQGRNYLISVFFDAKNFLLAKTSTIEGWKDTMREFEKTIKRKTGVELEWEDIKSDEDKFKDFYKLFNELRDKNQKWSNLDSSQAFKDIAEYMNKHDRMSYKSLYKNLKNKADKYYAKQKESEEEERRKNNIIDVFTFDDKV